MCITNIETVLRNFAVCVSDKRSFLHDTLTKKQRKENRTSEKGKLSRLARHYSQKQIIKSKGYGSHLPQTQRRLIDINNVEI